MAAAKLVRVISPEGVRGTVPESEIRSLPDGARVLTEQEVAQEQVDARYNALPASAKALGAVNTVLTASNPLTLGSGGSAPPTLAAYGAGVSNALTLGASDVGAHAIAKAVGGEAAGTRYAEQRAQEKTASPIATTAGELVGMFGGAALGSVGGAASALPSAGVSALGNAAERAVIRGLGGTAGRSALARAGVTAVGLGVQGGVEGALYGAAQQLSEDALGDHATTADRMFATVGVGALYGAVGGALLGGAGSLASSGVQAAKGAASSGLARMSSAAESAYAGGLKTGRGVADEAGHAIAQAGDDVKRAVTQAGDDAKQAVRSEVRKAVEGVTQAPAFEKEAASASSMWTKGKTSEFQKGLAYDQAWRAVGAGYGLQSSSYAKEAARFFPNGTKDLGEIAIRYRGIDVEAGVGAAVRNGTPEAVLARLETAESYVGSRIGEITASSGARVPVGDLEDAVNRVRSKYAKKAGFEHVVASIDNYRESLYGHLGLADPLLPRKEIRGLKLSASVQAVLEQRKALDQLVYQETKTLDPKMRVQALREFRTEMEAVVTSALDNASGRVSGQLAAEYKSLKRDYHGLRILTEAAEDSAARSSKGAMFGLTDTLRSSAGATVGTMVAGPVGGAIGGLVGGVASKVIRERGNAAAAVLLYRAAEMGTLTRAMDAVQGSVGRAAKGLLAPAPAARPVSSVNPIATASRAQKQIAALVSSPEAVTNRVATITKGLGDVAPNTATNLAVNMTRALAFLASKSPVARNVDPLAPPREHAWTPGEATRFARYVDAAENPMGVLDDVAAGKVTPEAVETLRVLTPTLYRDLQIQTLDSIAKQLAAGKPIPYESRLKIGTLFGVQADPSQNPRVRAFLQANITPAPSDNGGTMQGHTGPAAKPISIPTQHSAFDRLAEGGPGRR